MHYLHIKININEYYISVVVYLYSLYLILEIMILLMHFIFNYQQYIFKELILLDERI